MIIHIHIRHLIYEHRYTNIFSLLWNITQRITQSHRDLCTVISDRNWTGWNQWL